MNSNGRKIENLDELKKYLLDMLVYFDSVCKKYDIKYSLAYGTLLGAVRQEGFIPWDDDVDIMMTGDEYKKIFKIKELNDSKTSRYLLRYSEVEEKFSEIYSYPFAKLTDMNTDAEFLNTRDKYGLFIDIFPVTALPEEQRERKAYIDRCKKNKLCLDIGNTKESKTGLDVIKKLKNIRRNFYYKRLIKYRQTLIKDAFKYDFCCSKDVAVSIYMVYGEIMPRSWFEEYTYLTFEGKKFMCICKYKEYLKLIYGDYLKLPPQEKRKPHHDIIAYVKK